MRILLVEDESDLGNAIKRTLIQHNYIVDWAQDGKEGLDYLEIGLSHYTLGIFDWLLPKLSGVDLIRKVRQHKSSLPILMLTAKDSEEDKVIGLDAGADDYLVKPFGMAELLARLRALQRRSPQINPQQLKVGNLTLDYSTYTIFCQDKEGDNQTIALTNKEFQLLEYFLHHPNQIVTRDQLLSQLWEWESEPMSNVVAAQIRLLRRKLAPYGGDNWIETIYGLGYRFIVNS
ncbi:two component transcriptional regulator, winged helix family [Rippkaea orientalis PCC 8801]|uniref:Two component transcriptional regulator, winged helix family n=1 Tax=Rippkaea orientalis (strain PCC 8801 / RF-1) TaxID=41431 RepID=B7K1P6_RIPO1|nr:two-component system response regulator RppA [Rippkaea orientalis]ACK67588.1 two component transcriptional regulator, winged helix family [Rippkaea orientalis PCC 8801]